jgi:intein/homing endonuclease
MSKLFFDISEIPFSRQDRLRNIILPTFLSEQLAEEIGIHIGDGFMNIYNYSNRGNYWIKYTGNYVEEEGYLKNHLQNLLKFLYNFSGSAIKSNKDNSINITVRSKAIVSFKNKILSLPLGNKSSISVPEIILKSNKRLLASFMRGIADTDFSLSFKKKYRENHYYPVMHLGCNNRILVEQLQEILREFNIKSDTQFNENSYDKRTKKIYTKQSLYLNGKNNLLKWIETIGFNNPVHLTKFEIWKKFGFCPPRTTLQQRLKVLNGEIGIDKIRPQ